MTWSCWSPSKCIINNCKHGWLRKTESTQLFPVGRQSLFNEITTLHSWTRLFASLLQRILMLVSHHKAFISFHISAPLTWTWCTADLLPGSVFSDLSLVGMSQCFLTDRFAEGWGRYATARFFFQQQRLRQDRFCFASSYLVEVSVTDLPSVQALTDESLHHKRISQEHGMLNHSSFGWSLLYKHASLENGQFRKKSKNSAVG